MYALNRYLTTLTIAYQHSYNNLSSITRYVRIAVPNSCSYNYISKVLFTTPSWYLLTIGFGHMYAFRWALAPVRIPVLRNITQHVHTVYSYVNAAYGFSPSAIRYCKSFTHSRNWPCICIQQFSAHITDCVWYNPHSLAITDGVHCCEISSAYQYA